MKYLTKFFEKLDSWIIICAFILFCFGQFQQALILMLAVIALTLIEIKNK